MRIFLLLILLFFFFPFVCYSQTITKKQYNATRISIGPEINGLFDDACWEYGTWDDDFTQNQPYSGRPASQRTEFKILFDNDNLYVAIKAFDSSPDSIVNRLTRRDETDGDLAGIIVDCFHDLRTGFLFGVSSAGVKYDHMITNDGQNEDASWDPNWWVKTVVNSEGWFAEMKIPFSQFRFEKHNRDVWGLEVGRVLYRKNETTFWQHIPKDAPGMVHLFGELKGLEEIKPRKIFDITPYAVAKTETFQKDAENPFLSKGKLSNLNGGIDAKIGITNNMTMDLTINPDFGQVEADPSEVNLSAYETFFKEKRPFFIEGNNITNFGLGIGDGEVGNDNLFYSRRIGRKPQSNPDMKEGWNSDVPIQSSILGAAKLTGKTKNGLSIGIVEAITAEEKAEIDTIGGRIYKSVEPLTNYMIGRVQKDINDGNTLIGGIFTGTNRKLDDDLAQLLHKSAYTGGIDFTQYFKEKSWVFNLNSAFSLVEGSKKALENTQRSSARYFQRPDNNYTVFDTSRTSLAGSGGRMEITKLDGHWNFMSATFWKTPGFETNDLGYMRESDQILSVLWAGYNQWEPKGIYRNYNFNFDIYSVWNFGGNSIAKGFEWNARTELKTFWRVYAGGAVRTSILDPGILRGGPMMETPGNISARTGFTTDNRKKLVFDVSVNETKGFDNSSDNFNTDLEISLKPADFLMISFNPGYSKSFSELQYITELNYNLSDRYIFASIKRKTFNTSFRLNINLSPDLTLQYWGQPFIASGRYYDHKYITDPDATEYNNRFCNYTISQILPDGDNYNIDENNDGTKDYSVERSDFNISEFLSNLVIRWEYNPGSAVYIVWSQTNGISDKSGNFNVLDNLGDLFNTNDNRPHNVFLVKFSYRFGIK